MLFIFVTSRATCITLVCLLLLPFVFRIMMFISFLFNLSDRCCKTILNVLLLFDGSCSILFFNISTLM